LLAAHADGSACVLLDRGDTVVTTHLAGLIDLQARSASRR